MGGLVMKRFLAGILSAVLLMGSIPVYGAQDMGISPEAGYSVEGTELSQTEEALSGETALQETADTSNEENVEDSKENTEETPAPSEEEPDSQEPEIEPEVANFRCAGRGAGDHRDPGGRS